MKIRQAFQRNRRDVLAFDGLGESVQELRNVIANELDGQRVSAREAHRLGEPFIEDELSVLANERDQRVHALRDLLQAEYRAGTRRPAQLRAGRPVWLGISFD